MRGIFKYLSIVTAILGLSPITLQAKIVHLDNLNPTFDNQSTTHTVDQPMIIEPAILLTLADALKQAQSYAPMRNMLATRQQIREAELLQSGLRINPEL